MNAYFFSGYTAHKTNRQANKQTVGETANTS